MLLLPFLLLELLVPVVLGWQVPFLHSSRQSELLRVAIIGAGAAGSSSAYHLRKFHKESGLSPDSLAITIYEKSDHVGGRSTTVNVLDDPNEPVELGASIFVRLNEILYNATREFKLRTTDSEPVLATLPDTLAIWDGASFVYMQSDADSEKWTWAKLVWKYGVRALWNTKKARDNVVKGFQGMYAPPYFPFSNLTSTVHALELDEATGTTGAEFLRNHGIEPEKTGSFGHDLIQASTRVNYAQNLGELHGLATMVCMATEGAMSVVGGNWRIFDEMVRASRADLKLGVEVERVQRRKDWLGGGAKWIVTDQQGGEGIYDHVILAAPYAQSNISILPPPPEGAIPEIEYVRLHVTLVATTASALDPAFFGMDEKAEMPTMLLTTTGENGSEPGFNSISVVRSLLSRNLHVWKIFSPSPPSHDFLSSIFGTSAQFPWIYRKEFDAYPKLRPRVEFARIELVEGEGMWFTNGMEGFVSTMETEALMGMNVAGLVMRREENMRKGKEV
ncbi:FAD/NAD(P)-binding domain-containing protein [Saitoella complicata NRRL Y-17804]|uniref:FAD/NAD(P)-binding domain-containing protein n=1 Tax=Saitoella complicata (strain BCRC 22490 / CBS 7301 / JCM 7358 / NBRC 10748 / NRRL Y-17804) TaxID=698492 RepID=UPI000867572B|nr:FAD/NAD(P)-binding domain-containing protein [Saitoella complicata NRRL Y-17804]ODQ51587.1 FAD/NAD(P)-binding domain-containing protein [Saitoella complicata NRRL Y-17804]